MQMPMPMPMSVDDLESKLLYVLHVVMVEPCVYRHGTYEATVAIEVKVEPVDMYNLVGATLGDIKDSPHHHVHHHHHHLDSHHSHSLSIAMTLMIRHTASDAGYKEGKNVDERE